MFTTHKTRMLALILALTLALALLSGCAPQAAEEVEPSAPDHDPAALTWVTWGGYDRFWDLLRETDPDIEIEFVGYDGANYTGYSWAQMRADDIPDLFSTSQILDEELAKERLVDLSGYDFINELSTSVLDQVSIDGGIYLLPVSNAMYGIIYNKTLMEEMGWELPTNFAELEALCADIRAEGLTPGYVGTQLTGNTFSSVLNLAKTDWFTTPEGVVWERDFLAGNATAAGRWEDTMAYVQKYLDIGMYTADPDDISNTDIIEDYLAGRKAVFFTMAALVESPYLSNGDELGMMPYIGEDGTKNIYMYNPTSYIGISKRLTEPGNEEKLEKAIRVLARLYSTEGQAAFVTEDTPCVMNVLNSTVLPEDSMIYDVQQAMNEGRAIRMTYAGWENVLPDMGQAYKEWFRGENGMDAASVITRMDELQSAYLDNQDTVYFCQSTADFTLEETAQLVGKALGSAAGTDAAMVAYGTAYKEGGVKLRSGVTGKLYEGGINSEVANNIAPGYNGEYAILTMTGKQAKELAQAGFDLAGDGEPYAYVLVTRGGAELADDQTYQVAFPMYCYTEEVGQAYDAQVEKGSLRTFLRDWLTAQNTVSPDGNLWE
ncbi:MAG: ABC transporter substrate-binding protein [Muribaculaceae bacterium]|nr:ABC transporter substrate-binding protein [Muribaculaceae bacterium]